jgi:hypothetical protein
LTSELEAAISLIALGLFRGQPPSLEHVMMMKSGDGVEAGEREGEYLYDIKR